MTNHPYRVERVDGEPTHYRLAGPDFSTKAYPGDDAQRHLAQWAEVLNRVWLKAWDEATVAAKGSK